MVKKAAIIGLNYTSVPGLTLSGCIQDALNLQQFLIEKQGFELANIRLLTDDTPTVPTRANILAALNWLVSGAKAGDSLWFSYSGHGSNQRDSLSKRKDETDALDETIVPLDYKTAGQIIDDDLRDIVDSVPAGVRITWISDSCHSASIVDLPYGYEDASICRKRPQPKTYVSDDWATKTTTSKFKQYKDTAADILVISGCRDNSVSSDSWEDGKPCGAMTYSLLKSLRNAEKSGKSVISVQRLLKDMSCLLRCKGYTQKPNFSSGKQMSLDAEFTI